MTSSLGRISASRIGRVVRFESPNIHIAGEGHLAAQRPNRVRELGHVLAALGFQGMQNVDPGFQQVGQERPDEPAGVEDERQAVVVAEARDFAVAGEDELAVHGGGEERRPGVAHVVVGPDPVGLADFADEIIEMQDDVVGDDRAEVVDPGRDRGPWIRGRRRRPWPGA